MSFSNIQPAKTVLAVALSSVFVSAPLSAQNENEIETIEVIEKRQPYRGNVDVNDLPQAVTLLSDELLQDLAVNNFQTALGLVSSTARQNNFGGLWESFAIRGFAGDENLPSSYLINGFSAGRGFSGLRDTSNIQAIEVLKGPGSALYGRSEPGGTVNIVTKKPEFSQSGYVQLTAGEYDLRRFEGDYTNAIAANAAFRINGSYEESGSFRDSIEAEKLAITPSVLIKLSDRTSLSYELEFSQQEIPFDRGVPRLNGLELPASRFLGEPNDGPMDVEANGHQLALTHELANNWVLSLGFGYRDSSLEGFSSDTELSPGRQLLYVDGETLNRQRRYRDYDAQDLSARFEASGSFKALGYQHSLLIGADIYDYELHSVQHRFRVAWGSGDTNYSINVFNPQYALQLPDVAPLVDNLEEQQAWGIYIQDQINLSDNFKALLGARVDRIKQDVTNNFSGAVASQSQTEFNPRVGFVYSANQWLDFYTSYSEGFRPNSGADFQGQNFEPEKSKSLEAGIKWSLQQERYNGSIAIFQAEKSNILTADPVNSGFSAALGEAESSGIEIDAQISFTDNTQLSAGYAYVDVHTVNDMVNRDWGVDIPAGSRLINIPKHSYNLILRHYTHLLGYSSDLALHLQHVGDRLGETINPDYELPSYTLLNLVANVELADNLDMQLSIENLLDEDYYANSYSELWTMPGQPSRYQVSLNYSF